MKRNTEVLLKQLFRMLITASIIGSIDANAAVQTSNGEWPLLGRNADMQHNSSLTQVNTNNVTNLGLAWVSNIPSPDGLVGNPLVTDGVIYQSGPMGKVYANDLRTGKLLWQFSPQPLYDSSGPGSLWALRFNRGLAVRGDKVFVASGDCRLFAIDKKTGKQVWVKDACDRSGQTGFYGITGAPRVGNGMVFIGNACGDSGFGRGYVDAFDEKTGVRKWRFYTVPDDPANGPQKTPELQMAAKTWGQNFYEKSNGCGSVWESITYDEKLNQVYIGTDGPGPWNPLNRSKDAGDELFTNSVVALDASTGKYIWHYKVTPHDAWNFGATSNLMIADLPFKDGDKRVVMTAPKNGFFYVLDAKSGKFISANNFTKVNWASHIDQKTGRPVTLPDGRYWEKKDKKAVVMPGPSGAHNWHAMAYNDKTKLVYFPVTIAPTLIEIDDKSIVGGLRTDDYYGLENDPKWKAYGELVAWDPLTQKERWRVKRELPMNGGVLTTAGNLVFEGTADGKFQAFAADTGKLLWSYDVGGAVAAAPTTVEVDGQQLLLLPVGNGASANIGTAMARMTSTAQTRTPARLLAFKLDGKAALPKDEIRAFPKPPRPMYSIELAQQGKVLFETRSCAFCHGHEAESASGAIKDLRYANADTHDMFAGIVLGGLRKNKGMPIIPGVSLEDVNAIQAYVINEAWKGYNASQKNQGNQKH